jgi:membrane-associated phospholipid phosphatase
MHDIEVNLAEKKETDSSVRVTFIRQYILFIIGFFVLYFAAQIPILFWPNLAINTTIIFDFERHYPFVSFFYIFYYSAFFLPFLVPVYMKSSVDVSDWIWDLWCVLIISTLIYLVFPTEYVEYNPSFVNQLSPLLGSMEDNYHLFPSLHTALIAMTIFHLYRYQTWNERMFFWLWFVFILASTLFTHKHYLADLGGGFFLAIAVYWVVAPLRRRLLRGT